MKRTALKRRTALKAKKPLRAKKSPSKRNKPKKRDKLPLCKVCGTQVKSKGKNYCSVKCSYKDRPKKGKNIECMICKKIFYVMPCQFSQKYCSYDCMAVGFSNKDTFTCKVCGVEFQHPASYKKYNKALTCSKECGYKLIKKKNGAKRAKTKTSSLKKRLWIIFSIYIRWRDQGYCISCGETRYWQDMDAGHYVPKTAGLSLYFDERNVNSQCRSCNRFRHGNLSHYAIGLKEKYGDSILDELEEKRKKIRQISAVEYNEMIDYYIKKCEELNIPKQLYK